jgi:hypothetical protein
MTNIFNVEYKDRFRVQTSNQLQFFREIYGKEEELIHQAKTRPLPKRGEVERIWALDPSKETFKPKTVLRQVTATSSEFPFDARAVAPPPKRAGVLPLTPRDSAVDSGKRLSGAGRDIAGGKPPVGTSHIRATGPVAATSGEVLPGTARSIGSAAHLSRSQRSRPIQVAPSGSTTRRSQRSKRSTGRQIAGAVGTGRRPSARTGSSSSRRRRPGKQSDNVTARSSARFSSVSGRSFGSARGPHILHEINERKLALLEELDEITQLQTRIERQ